MKHGSFRHGWCVWEVAVIVVGVTTGTVRRSILHRITRTRNIRHLVLFRHSLLQCTLIRGKKSLATIKSCLDIKYEWNGRMVDDGNSQHNANSHWKCSRRKRCISELAVLLLYLYIAQICSDVIDSCVSPFLSDNVSVVDTFLYKLRMWHWNIGSHRSTSFPMKSIVDVTYVWLLKARVQHAVTLLSAKIHMWWIRSCPHHVPAKTP